MLMSAEAECWQHVFLWNLGWHRVWWGSTVVGGVAYTGNKHRHSPAVNSKMVQTWGPHTTFPTLWAVGLQFYYFFLPNS